MEKKVFYTYDNMNGDLLDIIRSVNEDNWRPEIILAIGRGGYIPGVYLSQWFDIPLHTYHYSLRDLERKDIFHTDLVNACSDKKVLVIDDISDTGETFNALSIALQKINANVKFSCLLYNIGEDNFEPDYWGTEINKTEEPAWIIYPWEEWWRPYN